MSNPDNTIGSTAQGHREVREPMGCGHPAACVISNGPPEHRNNYCGACAQLAREVAKAVAAEREACAQLAEEPVGRTEIHYDNNGEAARTFHMVGPAITRGPREIAASIRARGGK